MLEDFDESLLNTNGKVNKYFKYFKDWRNFMPPIVHYSGENLPLSMV